MSAPIRIPTDRVAPRQQRNWDWRAATNFIAGGAGGGLLLCAALATLLGLAADSTRVAILLALMLIAGGLTCVWFEIGRPWRALNVYRHVATSWMTREAMVALALFASGGWAWFSLQLWAVTLAGLVGLTFLYSQARILAANKGIPAWRHPRSIALMIATGLAEGAGLLACVASLSSAPIGVGALLGLLALIVARGWVWKLYLDGLTASGAPEGALKILRTLAPRLVVFGHLLPGLLIVAALAGVPVRSGLIFAAGIMIVAGGWFLKFTLVRRAAFSQGLALLHMPVRGRGPAGPAAKPGWKTLPD